MQTQRKIINISVSSAMERQLQQLARQENKTKNQILQEAIKSYQKAYKFKKDWERIRLWGEKTAQKMGIKSYDDIERIAG